MITRLLNFLVNEKIICLYPLRRDVSFEYFETAVVAVLVRDSALGHGENLN